MNIWNLLTLWQIYVATNCSYGNMTLQLIHAGTNFIDYNITTHNIYTDYASQHYAKYYYELQAWKNCPNFDNQYLGKTHATKLNLVEWPRDKGPYDGSNKMEGLMEDIEYKLELTRMVENKCNFTAVLTFNTMSSGMWINQVTSKIFDYYLKSNFLFEPLDLANSSFC